MKFPRILAATMLTVTVMSPLTARADWATYHLDLTRTGNDQTDVTHSMTAAWGPTAVDGEVFAEPLLVGNMVIVATEHDSIYAFDQASGTQLWTVNLGTPVPLSQLSCGYGIDPAGITGTPAIDVAKGILYVVPLVWTTNQPSTIHHELYALDLNNKGATLWHETIAPAAQGSLPGFDVKIQGQRGALALANGNVYIPFGGRNGDCGDYRGWVVGAPASGASSSLAVFELPSTTSGGGFWAASGIAVDANGNLYVTAGNTLGAGAQSDMSESVIKLPPNLSGASDYFQDPNWVYLDNNDIDLGSVGPAFLTPSLIFQVGKYGIGYLLNAANLGGAGHHTPLTSARVCPRTNDAAFGGVAYAPPFVYVPCYDNLVAVRVNTSSPSLSVAWTGPSVSFSGPPIVTGNLVWTIDPAGTLYGLDRMTGENLFTLNIGGANHFATPVAGNGRLFVGAGTNVYAWNLSPWFDWESLGGTIGSGPAVTTWGPGRLDVFAKGTDNSLIHKWYANNSWSNWESLGGVLAARPGAVAWSPGRIDVFVQGTDNNLWHRWYQGGWSAWENLGGPIASAPDVASWGSGRLDVFARGTDNSLQHKWYDGTSWHGFESLGNTLASEPGAVSWSAGRIDVFGRGTNNTLQHRWYQNGWSAWESLGGTLASGPHVASWGVNRLDVFVKGSNGDLMQEWYNGAGWQAWSDLGGQLADSPGAVSWAVNRIDVFVQGTDNALWHRWFD